MTVCQPDDARYMTTTPHPLDSDCCIDAHLAEIHDFDAHLVEAPGFYLSGFRSMALPENSKEDHPLIYDRSRPGYNPQTLVQDDPPLSDEGDQHDVMVERKNSQYNMSDDQPKVSVNGRSHRSSIHLSDNISDLKLTGQSIDHIPSSQLQSVTLNTPTDTACSPNNKQQNSQTAEDHGSSGEDLDDTGSEYNNVCVGSGDVGVARCVRCSASVTTTKRDIAVQCDLMSDLGHNYSQGTGKILSSQPTETRRKVERNNPEMINIYEDTDDGVDDGNIYLNPVSHNPLCAVEDTTVQKGSWYEDDEYEQCGNVYLNPREHMIHICDKTELKQIQQYHVENVDNDCSNTYASVTGSPGNNLEASMTTEHCQQSVVLQDGVEHANIVAATNDNGIASQSVVSEMSLEYANIHFTIDNSNDLEMEENLYDDIEDDTTYDVAFEDPGDNEIATDNIKTVSELQNYFSRF